MAYIFGGSTGETADSLKRKRAYVQAMLESAIGQQPQNIGDGIAVIGRALAGRLGQAALNKREKEGTAAAMKAAGGNSYIRDLLLGGGGGADVSGTGGKSEAVGSAGGDYFSNIRAAESGGNPNAKNPKSSATGLYQFTDGTWDAVAKAHPQLGLTPDGRRDPRQQEAAIRAFTADNARSLASAGIEPTGGNLYAAHFLGAGGARNVLTQPDSAPVAAIVGQGVVKANPFLARMTVGDFKRWTASKGGNDTLDGGEGEDQLRDTWGQPDPQRIGHGINTQTGAPASFSQPDPARYGGAAPTGNRLPQPNAMPQFNPMMAQGPMGPQSLPPDRPMPSGPIPQPQMAMPQQSPQPQPRPQMAPQVDPMQTAAIQQQMRPRGIVSPRAEDNGYTRGPGAAPQNMMPGQGGQGGGLLARLLMRQPMPQPAQGQPVAGGGGAATAQGGGGNDELMQMYELIDNPYLPESYRAALVDALKQKQQQGDPAYQLDMDMKRAQLDALKNPKADQPKPTDDMKEYEYAKASGAFKGSFTEWQTKGVRDQEVGFSREQGLRKEYTASPEYKRFDDVRASFERVRASAQRDSGAGDLGLIFGFMKMLDPGSVVREGEFANAQNTAGVPDRIRNLYNSVVNGERLQPGQRQEFVATASDLYQQEANRIGSVNERYTGIAKGYEIDPGRIIVQPQQYDPLDLGQAPPPTAGGVEDANQDGVIDYRDYFGRR